MQGFQYKSTHEHVPTPCPIVIIESLMKGKGYIMPLKIIDVNHFLIDNINVVFPYPINYRHISYYNVVDWVKCGDNQQRST